MSLWDNNILMGKQVLYAILGNDVLNLQHRGSDPQKRPPAPTPHSQ